MFLRATYAFAVAAVLSVLFLGPASVFSRSDRDTVSLGNATHAQVVFVSAVHSYDDATLESDDDDDDLTGRKNSAVGIDVDPRSDPNQRQMSRVFDVLSRAPKNSPPTPRS